VAKDASVLQNINPEEEIRYTNKPNPFHAFDVRGASFHMHSHFQKFCDAGIPLSEVGFEPCGLFWALTKLSTLWNCQMRQIRSSVLSILGRCAVTGLSGMRDKRI
jgi:hypothetical protein